MTSDKIYGCLHGLAAGDRNGGPVRMALRLGQSLVERNGFDAEDVCTRYLDWWRDGAFDTGPVFSGVYSRIAKGMPVAEAITATHEACNGETAGCNPAHRCPPLALAGFLSDSQLETALIEEARLSHMHQLAAEGSAFVGLLCRNLILGKSFEESLLQASGNRVSSIRRAAGVFDKEALKAGGYTPDAITAGIYFVKASSSFDEALQRALAFAGPANYCPVITGAVAGARWGRVAIPHKHLEHSDVLNEVEETAKAFIATWKD
jgi:ADP-ribosyl-[dinitrogen reductase] hydrolase